MPWKIDLISKNNFEYKSNDFNVNFRAISPPPARPRREFVLGNLSDDVIERRASTGSGHFALLGKLC